MLSGRIALFVCFFVLAMPSLVQAKDMQADAQCPPGGTIGQSCKDTTNGYVTQGKCTHINVCKAVSWNTNPPKGCGSSGNIYAPTADCPKGPQISNGTFRPTTSTPAITIDGTSPINSDIFDQAFSDIGSDTGQNVDFVSTTSLDGVEYVIFGGETLEAGAPLTEEPPEIVPPPRTTLALGSVYDLKPVRTEGVNTPGASFGQSYTPSIGTFTSHGSKQYSPPIDLISQTVQLSGSIVGAFAQSVGHLFENLGIVPKDTPAVLEETTPPMSLYDQVKYRQTFIISREAPAQNSALDHLWSLLNAVIEFISERVFPSFPR